VSTYRFSKDLRPIPTGRAVTFLAALTLAALALSAQPLPTLNGQTCGPVGTASVTATGTFDLQSKAKTAPYQVSVDVHCDAAGHPQGTLEISGLELNGSADGVMTATTFARLTSIAGAATTAHLSGRCSLAGPHAAATNDCRYWIMLSQIQGRPPNPPDVGIVAFSIALGKGAPLVSGIGRLRTESGKITIASTVGAN
jgi:hypothetical protein